MTKYLISFPSSAMDVSEDELPAVADASHAVVQEAKDAGVWVFGGGIDESIAPVLVDAEGSVTDGTYPQTRQIEGGYSILELPSHEAAQEWAARRGEAELLLRLTLAIWWFWQTRAGPGVDVGWLERAAAATARVPAAKYSRTLRATIPGRSDSDRISTARSGG